MAEFKPIFPAHAIERCSITLAFDSAVPDKVMARLLKCATDRAAKLGLRLGQQPVGFQVDTVTGKITPLRSGGPSNFSSTDDKQHLTLMPNAIAWATQQYIRWAQFRAQFLTVAGGILDEYNNIVSISTVQIEYWDRFIWTGDWSNFDVSQLLRVPSEAVAQKALQAKREWHSHIGWFEDARDARRLRNLNVDVVGLAEVTGATRPSVGIYTMARDQVSDPSQREKFEAMPIIERLDALHDDTKNALKQLISQGMADRIGLDSGG